MKLPNLLFIIIFFCYSQLSFSQTKSELMEIYNDGEYFFIREDYSEALYYYIQLLKYEPQNANLNFKAGTCLINIPGQEHRAIPFLLKASKDITTNYNRRSFNEKSAPLHTLYYLGNAYRINNEIDKALEVYNQFINSPDYYGNYNDRIVNEEIKSCERAKIIKDNPIKMNMVNLGSDINTKTADYHAVVSGNDQVLVFITTLKFYEGLFFTFKENDKWTSPVNINAQVISDGDMFPTGLSYDGKEMLLVKKTDVNNDIYYSKFENGVWGPAVPLNENINSRSNEDYASFSKDGNTIYFTSDRRSGFGGYDIYKSEKTGNQWGVAVNLGEIVNSPFNELAPFITADGNKLYFSSDGHFNMGGYDIFYSEWEGNAWQRPINVGYPLNTTGDNKMFNPVLDGNTGYICIIDEDGEGDMDIYRIILGDDTPQKNEKVVGYLDKMNEDDNILLKMVNEKTNDTTLIWFNKKTNRFHFDVPKGMKVIFEE